jgi:L-ascorbate metabolism protein UlaG (beta-lactamase superfamily)
MSVADALAVHAILGASNSLGIHWGTFATELGARKTRAELQSEKARRGVEAWDVEAEEEGECGGFKVIDAGVWSGLKLKERVGKELSFEEFLKA